MGTLGYSRVSRVIGRHRHPRSGTVRIPSRVCLATAVPGDLTPDSGTRIALSRREPKPERRKEIPMNEPPRQPSQGAKYALYYITAGSLLVIWSTVWFYYLKQSAPPDTPEPYYYICTGLFFSGVALLTIGIL